MCILGLVLNNSGSTTVVHLRDEKLGRPTAPPTPASSLICGRDLQRSGTWLGWQRSHSLVAGITNVRSTLPHGPTTSSRGLLVQGLLDGTLGLTFDSLLALALAGQAVDLLETYAPFNLLLVRLGGADGSSPSQALFLSNVEEQQQQQPAAEAGSATGSPSCSAWVAGPGPGGRAALGRVLPDGTHVIGNVPGIDDNRWGKLAWVQQGLAAAAQAQAGAAASPASPAAALAAYTAPFLRKEPLPTLLQDFSFSQHPQPVEAGLQGHVLIPWGNPIPDYGSRSLTCVHAAAGAAGGPFFAWMELDGSEAAAAAATEAAPAAAALGAWSCIPPQEGI